MNKILPTIGILLSYKCDESILGLNQIIELNLLCDVAHRY